MKTRSFAIEFFMFLCATAGISAAHAECNFRWHHYGDEGVRARIAEKIGAAIPDTFCKYTNEYELVLITADFSNSKMSQGFATMGLRKRGSNEIPARRHNATRWETGNFTAAYAKDLTANAAIDAVTEVMDDIPAYLPKRK